MEYGYDPIGKKELLLNTLTIDFYTEIDDDVSDEELDKLCDKATDVIDHIEDLIETFVIMPNEVRLVTSR